MNDIKRYSLPIDRSTLQTDALFESFLKQNSDIFANVAVVDFRGDSRYSYCPSCLKLIDLSDDSFSIEVDVRYYDGCKDRDNTFQVEIHVAYSINNEHIDFELDESDWRVEN